MGRPETRAAYSAEVRLSLAEGDLDHLTAELAAERAARVTGDEKLAGEQASLRQVLMGALVSIVVASVMLAINLAVSR